MDGNDKGMQNSHVAHLSLNLQIDSVLSNKQIVIRRATI